MSWGEAEELADRKCKREHECLHPSAVSGVQSERCDTEYDADNWEYLEYWGPIREIDNLCIEAMAVRLVGHLFGTECKVVKQDSGSFNWVWIIQFTSGAKVVLKVPAVGWSERWSLESEELLRSEALTMRYIHRTCKVPVPEVFAYDTMFANEIRAPFILMSHLNGESANGLWKAQAKAGESSGLLNQRRENFLRSLAATMSELRHVQFDAIGLPDFSNDECANPSVKRALFGRPLDKLGVRHYWETVPVFQTTRHMLAAKVAEALQYYEQSDETRGQEKFATFALEFTPPSNLSMDSAEDETFGLYHPDLDLQNILVDKEGNVTGILDWDGTTTMPQMLAWAAPPMFLLHDLTNDYNWPFDFWSEAPETYTSWRDFYTDAMKTALGGDPSWKFTAISPLFVPFIYESDLSWWCAQIFSKILPTICHSNFLRHLETCGWVQKDWLDIKEYLRPLLSQLFHSDSKSRIDSPRTLCVEPVEEVITTDGKTAVDPAEHDAPTPLVPTTEEPARISAELEIPHEEVDVQQDHPRKTGTGSEVRFQTPKSSLRKCVKERLTTWRKAARAKVVQFCTGFGSGIVNSVGICRS